MINTIRVIIPNLDRRPDRWECCLNSLRAQNVPEQNIQRFAAVDGLDFVNDKGDHGDLTLIDRYMKRRLGAAIPPFLANHEPKVLTAYAWKCTWLLAVTSVLQFSDSELACVMIDDHIINIDYAELLGFANSLVNVCFRDGVPFLCTQLSQTAKGNHPDRIIPECTTFQRGFATPCDGGILYSAAGARLALDLSNNIEKQFCDPTHVSGAIQALGPHPGVFGISGFGEHPHGIVFVDNDVHKLNLHCYGPDITDNGLSTWLIANK